LALSRFGTEEADSVRTNNGRKEYDEVSLRAWLSAKYHEDIIEEFGPI
jgi:hypothetical protein